MAIMKMKYKAGVSYLGWLTHGRAAIAAAVLAGAISLLVSGCGGGSGSTATPPAEPTVTSFTGNNTGSVASGASVALSWTVTNATSVAITGVNGVTGTSTAVTVGSGTTVTVNPVDTTTYTLTATNSVGSAMAKYSVTVNNVTAANNCTSGGTSYTLGTGSTVVEVASAANFTSPLLAWLNNFFFNSNQNPNYTADVAAYKIIVCSDSTGNFESAIAAGTYVPNIFFAADTSNESASYTSESMEYAQGYPILLGYTSASGKAQTIANITSLIGTTPSGTPLSGSHADISATIASGNLSGYALGTLITNGTAAAPGSLIADPRLAPYGVVAVNILGAMNSAYAVTYTPGSSGTITGYPTWLQNPTSWSNITKAFNAIGTSGGAPTGFAAFSAICTAPPNGAVWVRFTGADVLTKQAVANLEFNPGGGTEIYNLIKSEISDTNNTWLKYITTDYGFGGCYAGV
jgi:hypothetical protein